MTDDLTRRLEKCYSAIIHDVMRAMGMKDFVLPHEIRPLFAHRTVAGPVFTLEGELGSFDNHETLLAWTGFLGDATPGHVVICQPNNHAVALMGELSAETLQHRGVRGYIVDGACRDVGFIEKLGFPVCYRHATPEDIVGRWLPTAGNNSIEVGGVTIHPGDYVLADIDGIVILPKASADEIIETAEAAVGTENRIRSAILDGMHPRDAYLEYGKF
jgi:regulator of RNase E activity RraA